MALTFFLLTLFLSSPLSLFFLLSLSLLSSPLSLFFLLSLSLLSSSLSHSSFSCPFFFLSFIHLCFVSFSLLSSLSFFFSPRTYSSLPTIYCFAHGKRNYWYIICMLWIQQAQFSVLILKFWSWFQAKKEELAKFLYAVLNQAHMEPSNEAVVGQLQVWQGGPFSSNTPWEGWGYEHSVQREVPSLINFFPLKGSNKEFACEEGRPTWGTISN